MKLFKVQTGRKGGLIRYGGAFGDFWYKGVFKGKIHLACCLVERIVNSCLIILSNFMLFCYCFEIKIV